MHPPYILEYFNRANVKITSTAQQIITNTVFSTSHCELNRKVNAHYRYIAFIRNLVMQAISYFMEPTPQI